MNPNLEIESRCGTGQAGCGICRDEAEVGEVTELRGASARVRSGGREFEVALELVGNVRPGDRLLVQAGCALARLEA